MLPRKEREGVCVCVGMCVLILGGGVHREKHAFMCLCIFALEPNVFSLLSQLCLYLYLCLRVSVWVSLSAIYH